MKAIEVAAFEYERENRGGILSGVDIINAFLDGAKWQKEQMEEAVEGVVHHFPGGHYIATNTEQLNARLRQFDQDERVQIFIVKKEDGE